MIYIIKIQDTAAGYLLQLSGDII